MHQVALLVALSATTGLFGGHRGTSSCSGGACARSYGYAQHAYAYPQPAYQHQAPSYYPAPQQATAAPQPYAAPMAQVPVGYSSYYYPPAYHASAPTYAYGMAPGGCPGGNCYRR